jgi:type III pantothenate kinase
MIKLLVIDLGNTLTKIALFDHNGLHYQTSFLTKQTPASEKLLKWLNLEFQDMPLIEAIAISSVVPSYNYYWRDLAKQLNRPIFFLSPETTFPIILNLEEPLAMGADRLAGLIGAQKLFPQENVVVVDMGTATTINLLTKENIHPGGAILAGLQTSLNNLMQATALLPTIQLQHTPLRIGKNTKDQLRLNFHFYMAGLKSLSMELAKNVFGPSAPYKVIGTGGYAVRLANLDFFDCYEPDLKLIGIHQAYLEQMVSTAPESSPASDWMRVGA